MNDNLVVAHPTNETATQTDLDSSSGPDFLDHHSASIRSTVDYHGYLRDAIAFWNTKQTMHHLGWD
jgi:hypothetical protein